MALNAAEEETIEALKKWWDENGRQLVLIVVAVLTGYTSGYFGKTISQLPPNLLLTCMKKSWR